MIPVYLIAFLLVPDSKPYTGLNPFTLPFFDRVWMEIAIDLSFWF